MTNAPHDTVIAVSIDPRPEDRELAKQQILNELVDNTAITDIVEMLITKQQVIIQAERLEAKAVNAIVYRGEVV